MGNKLAVLYWPQRVLKMFNKAHITQCVLYWTVKALFVVNKALLAWSVLYVWHLKHTFPFDFTHAKFYKTLYCTVVSAMSVQYIVHGCKGFCWYIHLKPEGRRPEGWGCLYQYNPKQPWYQLIYSTPKQRAFIYKAHFTSMVVYYIRATITRWVECYNIFS